MLFNLRIFYWTLFLGDDPLKRLLQGLGFVDVWGPNGELNLIRGDFNFLLFLERKL